MVIAYMMQKNNTNLEETLKFVQVLPLSPHIISLSLFLIPDLKQNNHNFDHNHNVNKNNNNNHN